MRDQTVDHIQQIRPNGQFWTRPKAEESGQTNIIRLRGRLRPLRLHYRQMIHRLGLRHRYFITRQWPDKILFIIAQGRTGSNLLADYFRSIPNVSVTEEILNEASPIGLRRRWRTKGMSLRHIDYSLAMPGRIAVAKLAPHQLRWHGITLTDLCERYPSAQFIFLYRRNLSEQYISWCILFLTGQERAREGKEPFRQRITVNREHFIEFCRRMRSSYQEIIEEDKGPKLRSVAIAYEDLAADPQRIFNEAIFSLLGLDSTAVTTQMKKQNTRRLSEIVANYEEMVPYFESKEAILDITLGRKSS